MIEQAAYSTALFLAKTLPVVAITFYLISHSIRKGYLERLAKFLEPLLKRAGISEIAAVSVAVCFLSPTASYSMLSQSWREGKISNREVIAISFLNSFPSVFSHLYAFFLPFVIPVLGFAGIIYTATRFVVAIVKSCIGLILARKWKSSSHAERISVESFSPTLNLIRVGVVMAVTYFLASLAFQHGVFDVLSDAAHFMPLPPNSVAIAAVEFFNVRAAVVLAAGFIDEGLHWKWAVVGLILGNVISFSARSIKHSLPMHIALFGKFGTKIVALNAIATLAIDLLIVVFLVTV